MSSKLFYDSDDERDSFDVERRQIEMFRTNGLSTFNESSEDDEEGIIDGSIVPSSSKARSRARHFFLDLSTASSSPSVEQNNDADDENDLEGNPFDIISKSIDIEPMKKKKSLGVRKSRILLDTTDIYDKDENDEMDSKLSNTNKSDKKSRIQKPTKATILETERKMQQLSRSEHLVLPTFIPKALETWQALGKRSRQELLNEIRAKNPSFTPQDPDLPEILVVDAVPTAASTLADLTKIIDDKPSPKANRLSRFLNADILNKKPTISSLSKQSNIMIDLSDTKKPSNPPTVKSSMNISLNCIKSPASKKQLLEMQKQLGIRMRAKRTAMLAENAVNIPMKDDDDVEDADDNDDVTMNTTDESNDTTSDVLSTTEKDNEILQVDEDTRHFISDEDETDEDEEEENTNPPPDPNRPSLKTILARMESSTELPQAAPSDQNGQTEWFASSRPAEFDTNLELLCSGAFGGDNVILPSQNYTHVEPMVFSPLPTTQIDDDDDDIVDTKTKRSKVRQLIDDEEDEPINSGSAIEESEQEEEEEEEDNEELVDYKKQLFEMEAEESGSEVDEKEADEESDNEEPDEELAAFIDTAAIEMDENDVDNMAKVHLKIKAKEDEHQLKLLKEQYLDFDGDDDGRRIQISKGPVDDEDEDDDPDFHSEVEDDDDDDDDEDPTNINDRISELERQRSIQDNQAEELHLDEDLDHIGQYSSMFQKGLALKQKKVHSTTESANPTTTDSASKKSNSTRSVTLSSVLLAQRFSSTLLAPVNKNNIVLPHNNTANETNVTSKKTTQPSTTCLCY